MNRLWLSRLGLAVVACAAWTTDVHAEEEEALAKARSALETVRRLKGSDLDAKPALKAAIGRLATQLQGQPELVELVRDFHLTNQYSAIFQYVLTHPAEAVAGEAMRLLLAESPERVRTGLSDTNQALPLLTALGNAANKEVVPLLQPWLAEAPGRTVAERRTALRGLIKSQEGAAAVVALASAKQLPADLQPLASTELQSVRWPKIKADAAAILPPPPRTESTLPPVSDLVRRTGDPVNGARIFQRTDVACINCHQVNGVGADFGPKLSEIGTKLGKDAIYDAILEPSAGISFGYEAWMFTFKNGDDAFGLLASETEDEIAVKVQGGNVTKYRKADLVKREKQKQSIMPEGLTANLKTQELVDLVEYLASLKHATP